MKRRHGVLLGSVAALASSARGENAVHNDHVQIPARQLLWHQYLERCYLMVLSETHGHAYAKFPSTIVQQPSIRYQLEIGCIRSTGRNRDTHSKGGAVFPRA